MTVHFLLIQKHKCIIITWSNLMRIYRTCKKMKDNEQNNQHELHINNWMLRSSVSLNDLERLLINMNTVAEVRSCGARRLTLVQYHHHVPTRIWRTRSPFLHKPSVRGQSSSRMYKLSIHLRFLASTMEELSKLLWTLIESESRCKNCRKLWTSQSSTQHVSVQHWLATRGRDTT